MLEAVRKHYEAKLKAHGPTHKGVDWNTKAGQERRLYLLTRDVGEHDSVNDLGCGYGAMLPFLSHSNEYTGYDISPKMIAQAKQLWPGEAFVVGGTEKLRKADWTLASGIFNVGVDPALTVKITNDMLRVSRKGIGFNALSMWANPLRAELNYEDVIEHMQGALALRLRITVYMDHPGEFTIIATR